MHRLAVRKDVAERDPWLPVGPFGAFAAAKRASIGGLRPVKVRRLSLPRIAAQRIAPEAPFQPSVPDLPHLA